MSQVPRFLFLISGDSFLLQQEIAALSLQFSPEKLATTHVFWGDDGLDATFYEQLSLQGLFSQPKIVILRNAQLLPAATLRTLSNAINTAPEDVFIIVCLEVPIERGKPKIAAHVTKLPCYAFAEKKHWVTLVPGLTKNTLANYLIRQAKTLNITLPQSLLNKLIDILPLDAATIQAELQKMALLADAKGVVPDSAHTAIHYTLEGDIFRLLTAIQTSRQTAPVWRQLLEYNQSGESLVFAFLVTLTREARNLWQLCMGEQPAMPPSIIPAKRSLAKAMGPIGIAKLWDLAATTEKAIKTGEQSPEQAFDILVAHLSRLFHPSR